MVVFILVATLLSWQLTKPIMDVVKAADDILVHMVYLTPPLPSLHSSLD